MVDEISLPRHDGPVVETHHPHMRMTDNIEDLSRNRSKAEDMPVLEFAEEILPPMGCIVCSVSASHLKRHHTQITDTERIPICLDLTTLRTKTNIAD